MSHRCSKESRFDAGAGPGVAWGTASSRIGRPGHPHRKRGHPRTASGAFVDGKRDRNGGTRVRTWRIWYAQQAESLSRRHPNQPGRRCSKLVKQCDVVTDNFRPGTMRRLGFDHESLAQVNARIITLSSTAYGHTGPWSKAGSRARTVDSVCGMSYLTGFEGGPSMRASNNYMDHSTGNNVAYALLLALIAAKRTGKECASIVMQETGVSCIAPQCWRHNGASHARGWAVRICGKRRTVYPCAGKDRWIAIAGIQRRRVEH